MKTTFLSCPFENPQKGVNKLFLLVRVKGRNASFHCNMFENCFTRCGMKIKMLEPPWIFNLLALSSPAPGSSAK